MRLGTGKSTRAPLPFLIYVCSPVFPLQDVRLGMRCDFPVTVGKPQLFASWVDEYQPESRGRYGWMRVREDGRKGWKSDVW